MLDVVGVSPCAPAGSAWISLASSDKPEPTAEVKMVHTHTRASSVVGKEGLVLSQKTREDIMWYF